METPYTKCVLFLSLTCPHLEQETERREKENVSVGWLVGFFQHFGPILHLHGMEIDADKILLH